MKITMLETPKGRPEYQKGETYEFNGASEESYARKFIVRGWAEPADKAAKEVASRDASEARAKAEQEAKDRAEAEAKIKAAAEASKQQNQQGK